MYHTCFCCSWHLLDAQRTESPSLTMCKSWHPVLLKTEQRTKKHISKLKRSAPSCDVKSQPAVTNDPTLSDWWPLPNWLMIPLSHSWSHSHWRMIPSSMTEDATLIDSWSHPHWLMIPLSLTDDPIFSDWGRHPNWLMIPLSLTHDPTLTDSWSHSHWLMIPLSLTHDPTLTDGWSQLQTEDPTLTYQSAGHAHCWNTSTHL